jgi:putative ABC transport system substrate-binding protein
LVFWQADLLTPARPSWPPFGPDFENSDTSTGKNVVIEVRYGYTSPQKFRESATELWGSRIDIFVTHGITAAVQAAEQASNVTPIVFVANPDPVGSGFAASLARPGGRITGVSDAHTDLVGKRVGLLKEAVLSVSRVAVLHRGEVHLPQLQGLRWRRTHYA